MIRVKGIVSWNEKELAFEQWTPATLITLSTTNKEAVLQNQDHQTPKKLKNVIKLKLQLPLSRKSREVFPKTQSRNLFKSCWHSTRSQMTHRPQDCPKVVYLGPKKHQVSRLEWIKHRNRKKLRKKLNLNWIQSKCNSQEKRAIMALSIFNKYRKSLHSIILLMIIEERPVSALHNSEVNWQIIKRIARL